MVFLLASFAGIAPLSWDMTLAAMPLLTRDFSTTPEHVQLTLSLFAIGFGVGQLFYGPLSDRYGRKPVLLGGFALYVLTSVGCAFAADINQLIVLRLLQGLGGCVGPVLSRAIVRDLYDRSEGARKLSLMTTITAAAPVVAPVIGGLLVSLVGWPGIFVTLALLGLATLVGALLFLAESNPHIDLQALRPRNITGNWGRFFGNRRCLAFAAINACIYAAIFCYISGSSFVMMDRYGLSPRAFGFIFMLTAFGLMGGAYTNARLVRRWPTDRIMLTGFALTTLAATLVLAALATGWGGPLAVAFPTMLYAFSMTFIMPNSVAAAMEPMPEIAGSVSSLIGFLQMMAGALAGYLVNLLFIPTGGWGLGACMLGFTLIAVAAYVISARK